MKITKILLTTMVLTSIATSAFASRAVNIISGDGKNIATAFRDRDAYRWDTSTGALVKSGTDLEYIVSLNEDLKEIRSAKFKENVGPFGEKSNLDINSDILVYTKSNVDNSNSGTSYLNAHDLYFRTDNRNHPNLSASSTFRADLISMYQNSKSIRIAPGMDGIKAEDISENYSEFNHLTSIPTMSHLDKRGETKIDGSVIELHNKAVNGEDEQLTAIDGKHISFNKSGDYKTSVDVDGISTLHYDQGMSAYAGGIDVWGHKNDDDTTELREMSFSVSKVDVGGQQIHGVSNGEADTDAVNVAQLKKAEEKINNVEAEAKKHTTVVAGDNTTVTQGTNAAGGAEYKVAVNKDLVEMNSVNFGKATDDVRARIDKDSARFFNGSENIGVTPKGIQIENTDTLEQATFTKTGMYASEGDKTVYYTTNGISAGDQIINNVKAGVADTDAVNVSQLKKVKDEITAATGTTTVTAGDHIKVTPTINSNSRDYKVSLSEDITNQINNNTTNIDKNKTEIDKNRNDINKNTDDIKNLKGNVTDIQNNITNINNNMNSFRGNLSKMDKRIDKSVAGAAALAALHPLDFDPDAKWDFAAGYGHYRSGDAAAIGAFYRPNEDVQLSIGSTVGSDETVFNAGLSVKVGAHSGVSRSRVAIGKEVLALKKTVAEQNAQIQKLTALLNGVAGTNMKADHTTLFPDVAANHWAYEAVSDLSRRGLVEGYPDGTFGGDRLLTRYEFAQIVYRAIQDGVTVDDRLVTEFSPEMALFRVDTVAKNAKGEPTIERVRVNKK
ncbi:S-layer homology domain-containing protein [Veillonella sp.]|uniref:S-layer homology domain-containing protein n=1 Tax=Veillonella sp. TaxID=1926307 RepID=UPI0029074660|nr:S-layer homology domain-containing protein [Veillonella sp.]MDU3434677.1 S-layer homology domain-containing protein [Veillonella sp.]